MRNLIRSLILVLLCLVLTAPAAGAAKRSRTERPPSMSEVKRKANLAAARYDKAQAALARVQNDIDKLERQVGKLNEQMAPLRASVTRRAVVLYQTARGIDAVASLGQQADPQESARGARLVAQASAVDMAAIAKLAGSAAQLRFRQDELKWKRLEKQSALDKMSAERSEVEAQLEAMAQTALAQKVVQRRSFSARASRNAPPPIDPGNIPVATNFICPIAGPVAFSDSWGDARSGGRRHKGTDMMNQHGTPNLAVVSGTIERHDSGAGGIGIYLHGDDGHTYMYMHLASVIGPMRRVAQGEVIGTTGATGNARGGSPHTHFEIHPGGGAAVNPYPTVRAHC